MKRGDLYRVYKGNAHDPRKYRVFAVVSRQIVIDSRFSTVICAPVYSRFDGLSTQVPVGIDQGLKTESSLHCDELVSIPKSRLTHFVGSLSEDKSHDLDQALKIALALEDTH